MRVKEDEKELERMFNERGEIDEKKLIDGRKR